MKMNLVDESLRKHLIQWGMPPEYTEQEARQWIDKSVPVLGRYFGFIDIVWAESDRGCVICASALIDDALEGVLRESFRRTVSPTSDFMKTAGHKTYGAAPASVIDSLLTRRPQPPIGSFAVRTKLARALCLINDEVTTALDMMRQMRNDAAHLARQFTFANPEYRIEKLFAPLSHKEQTLLGAINQSEPAVAPARRVFELAATSIYFRLSQVMGNPDWAAIRWGDPLGPFDHQYDAMMGQSLTESGSSDDIKSTEQI